jgi:YbbR domain-containing protein
MPVWWRRFRKFLDERILSDWPYKLVALAAAFIIWAYVAGQQSVHLVLTVPLRFQNIPPGSVLVDQKTDLVQVTLSGRRQLILALKPDQVWIALDLSGLRDGRNLYVISSRDVTVPSGLEVQDVSPSQLSIQLAPQFSP